jgi:FlaA1/EpsC-like NDP-sugar epimerase
VYGPAVFASGFARARHTGADVTLIDRSIAPVLALPRVVKRSIVLCLDASLCLITVWLAFYLRLGDFVSLSGPGWPAAVVAPAIALPIFVRFGLYRAVFRYIGTEALVAIANAVMAYGIIYFAIFTAVSVEGVPRTIGIIQPILLFLAIGSARLLGRYWLTGRYNDLLRRGTRKKVLIYGAGSAGRQLASAIAGIPDMEVAGFLDDDQRIQGSMLGGKVVFAPARMENLVKELGVVEILLAIPSATRARRNVILKQIRALEVAVRTLPDLLDVARGSVTVTDLRPLEIEDLLGREPVVPDVSLLERNIRGMTVLVTGAGGSIGGELCRQIVRHQPATLVLVESSEFALYEIHHELERQSAQLETPVQIVPLLASVCDEARMRRIFAVWQPQTIYHAAAFKHVPLVEHNVTEGVRNNALGTWNCARMAAAARCENFVLISTDKAVRPTNVMGASKRLSELGLQTLAHVGSPTRFSMVRFGNVLGSSGSVVPLFRQQISAGGPVTVTHPDITRYFMTIPEAAQLVIQAGSLAKGGEVFVLDMGRPVKVLDLAKRMIRLSGLRARTEEEPDGDIAIEFTGLRPGEKLYEELLIGDNPSPTEHPRIMMANESFLSFEAFEAGLARLTDAIERQDPALVRQVLAEMVPEYRPPDYMVDHLARSKAGPRLRVVSGLD